MPVGIVAVAVFVAARIIIHIVIIDYISADRYAFFLCTGFHFFTFNGHRCVIKYNLFARKILCRFSAALAAVAAFALHYAFLLFIAARKCQNANCNGKHRAQKLFAFHILNTSFADFILIKFTLFHQTSNEYFLKFLLYVLNF